MAEYHWNVSILARLVARFCRFALYIWEASFTLIYAYYLLFSELTCRNVMVRINSKQGVPKDGRSPIESFLVY